MRVGVEGGIRDRETEGSITKGEGIRDSKTEGNTTKVQVNQASKHVSIE